MQTPLTHPNDCMKACWACCNTELASLIKRLFGAFERRLRGVQGDC